MMEPKYQKHENCHYLVVILKILAPDDGFGNTVIQIRAMAIYDENKPELGVLGRISHDSHDVMVSQKEAYLKLLSHAFEVAEEMRLRLSEKLIDEAIV
jgi:hypothetical protein